MTFKDQYTRFAKGAKGKSVIHEKRELQEEDHVLTNEPFWPFKAGDVPEVKEDSEYPDWVFTLGDFGPTLNQLRKQAEEEGVQNLEPKLQKRLFKLENRAAIKAKNMEDDF